MNIELLDALADKVREILADFKIRSTKDGEHCEINIYVQYLPGRKKKEDETFYPYVIVCFDEQTVSDENEIKIYFLIGIRDDNEDKQGFRDVLQIANKIYYKLLEQPLVGNFRIERECKIILQQEETFPFFIGGIETNWINSEQINMIRSEFD